MRLCLSGYTGSLQQVGLQYFKVPRTKQRKCQFARNEPRHATFPKLQYCNL